MFVSHLERDRLSKRAMIDRLSESPFVSSMPARNTLDYTLENGERRIRLHNTDVLIFHKAGGFTIRTGGWNTHTTRARINAFLPAPWGVYTSKGTLYLRGQDKAIPFREEITVGPRGKITPDISESEDARLKREIDAFMKAWRKRGLPTREESTGDPWILTDEKVSESVMRYWVKSRYVFRLLYALALQYAGINARGISLALCLADKEGLVKHDFARIRRYVRACLGLAA